MGKYSECFDRPVDRTGFSSVKQFFTPDDIKESDNMSLWGAEFEFPAAPFVVDAVTEWASRGLYAYTVDDGSFAALVSEWLRMHRGWEVNPEWIVPVYGITSSLATAMRAFTDDGDGIIGMQPGYHMYWHAVELSGRRRVENFLLCDGERYDIDWDLLEKQMADPANKMFLMCNPHNPIAKVFSPEDIERIGKLAADNDVIIFNDEIFAECLYEGVELRTFNQVCGNDLKVITAVSLGKWQSCTGTNQANLVIPDDDLRAAFTAERDREFYGSMNPMMLPAYRAAYTEDGEEWLRDFMEYIRGNYELAAAYFGSRIPGFHTVKPEGTFVLWVDATEFCRSSGFTAEADDGNACISEEAFMDFLVKKAFFHVDPGTQYDGEPGFFRMTLSVPRAELEKCLRSLEDAVVTL